MGIVKFILKLIWFECNYNNFGTKFLALVITNSEIRIILWIHRRLAQSSKTLFPMGIEYKKPKFLIIFDVSKVIKLSSTIFLDYMVSLS